MGKTVKVIKRLCLAAILVSGSLAADQVEVIKITEGAGTSNTSFDAVLILQALQAEVRSLRGQVENQEYQLQKLKQQQQEMYADLDGRLGGNSFKAASPAVDIDAGKVTTAVLAGDEAQDYSTAFAYVKTQELVKAEAAFLQYMKRHPSAQRVSNAIYWLGEINSAQGKLPESLRYFVQLLTQYPKSAKIPDAMYKLGRVNQRMGNADEAITVWQKLVSQFPKSTAASLAKNALN